MTETKLRIRLSVAERLAHDLVDLCRPFCERIEVAGSIRRCQPTVGDIELVAIPIMRAVIDLFGEAQRPIDALAQELERLRDDGVIQERTEFQAWGPRHKRFTFQEVNVDLFCVLAPAQWGVILLIRTGPAEFGKRLVSHRRAGGLLPEWLTVRDGALWQNETLSLPAEQLSTPEEADVFQALNLAWIPPEKRS